MNNRLADLRDRIDEIDAQLVALLAQRFEVTEQVGILKTQLKSAPQDSSRETRQFEKLTLLSEKAGVDPEAIKAIWRTLIDEVIKRHKQIQAEGDAKS